MEISYKDDSSGEDVLCDDMNCDLSIFDELLNWPASTSASAEVSSGNNSGQLNKQVEHGKPNALTRVAKRKSSSKLTAFKAKNIRPVVVQETKLKMYSFPSFDKSDALIYLPSTLARLTNCGDIEKFTRILKGHCTKDCVVTFPDCPHALPLSMYLGLVEIGDVLYPDNFMCMHTTKVIDNQITATMYYKYTDIPAMHAYISTVPGVSDNALNRAAFIGDRKELTIPNFQLDSRPEGVKEQICAIVDKNEEFVVYGSEVITFTFDPYSKKINNWRSDNTLLYIRYNGEQYDL